MNKLLIVLLAVCLVSVHAFVKRDAPATATTEKNLFEDFQKTLTDVGQNIADATKKALSPEEMQKNANVALEGLSKAIEELKNKVAAAGAQTKE